MILGGALVIVALVYFSSRTRGGLIPVQMRGYLPRFNPFNGPGGGAAGYGGQGQPNAYAPSGAGMGGYNAMTTGVPIRKGAGVNGTAAPSAPPAGGSLESGMMFSNPMMMSMGSSSNGGSDTLDSFFSTGDKLIGTMMMGDNNPMKGTSAMQSDDGSMGLGLSNPLFSQLAASKASKATVTSGELTTELKKVTHLISKVIDSIDDKNATQEMLELANRASKSWEKAHKQKDGEIDSENISNLVDVKVTLNKLEQVSYMNIQMPASDKAKMMNIIATVRTKLKAFSEQKTPGGSSSLRRSSIISSMVNVKEKMKRKIVQHKLKY